MRIPLSWLNELVPLQEQSLQGVHAALVRMGFEEEATHDFDITGPVVVGQVLSKEPEEHKNGKVINWCQVRVAPAGEQAADGGADVRGIVCGAHNFEAGDLVVAALPGAVLPGGFEISPRKTYGHISDGMLASARELGLGEDHDGIIVLDQSELQAAVGSSALDLLHLDDSAVEINVTPDRGYAFSVRGVAREYSHAIGTSFTDPFTELNERAQKSSLSGISAEITDNSPVRGNIGARGIVLRLVTGVDNTKKTPQWMLSRLILSGQRSTGLVSDIANYVMLELGNPLHAYDFAKISGAVCVRRALPGEQLVTIDGVSRELHTEDLVIADDNGALSLAGVMGGESSKTTAATSDVLIEAATFDPVSIARSARRHKLPSEAAKRFERTVDPLLAAAAAQRMAELLAEYAGGSITELGAVIAPESQAHKISLPHEYVTKLIGVVYTETQVQDSLALIGCDVQPGSSESEFIVTPPSWRPDLKRPADLAEEVTRVIGYEKIPAVLPVAPPGRGLTREQRLRRTAANAITAFGFTEVQCAPFVGAAALAQFDQKPLTETLSHAKPDEAVSLINPLDGQAPLLRKALLPALLNAAQRNTSRGLQDMALAEFGSIFIPAGKAPSAGTDVLPPMAQKPDAHTLSQLNAVLPLQPRHAAGLLTGEAWSAGVGQQPRKYEWADAIDAVRALALAVGAHITVEQASHPAFHPGRTAAILLEGELLGYAGELLPELTQAMHLPHRVNSFEIDLDRLIHLAPRAALTAQLSTYPAATQDLTLLVPAEVSSAEVSDAVVKGAGELLENIQLVADYRGEGVPSAEKALTFSLRFRALDRTLKSEEASAAKLAGVAAAQQAFGARIRD